MFSVINRGERIRKELKKNPEKTKEYLKKAREHYYKNRDEICERYRTYGKEMREIAKELGKCSMCFKEKDNPKYKTCSLCREKMKIYYYNKRIKS